MSSSGRRATTVERGVGLWVDGDVGSNEAWRWGEGTDGGATATGGGGRRGAAKGSLSIRETPKEKGRKATGGGLDAHRWQHETTAAANRRHRHG
ncbi:hypothetical protein E2562_032357 [Oryza meyeriana var. granulata]|uniref:DUF834 domain-containing protein n=1 Tax=Oryza meyeriana var. granulata TaxID=110450 RepID=A0A6G1E4B7_9ORYZ|nr:hypothetical protein E2562_032357 [Oryza meyeriana var. granulata]